MSTEALDSFIILVDRNLNLECTCSKYKVNLKSSEKSTIKNKTFFKLYFCSKMIFHHVAFGVTLRSNNIIESRDIGGCMSIKYK